MLKRERINNNKLGYKACKKISSVSTKHFQLHKLNGGLGDPSPESFERISVSRPNMKLFMRWTKLYFGSTWIKLRSSVGSEVQLKIGQTILQSLHFIGRSFQVWSFHFMVSSFHSFRVKLVVKCALWCLWLKERGTHMSSTLVSACSLKTREKFRLYYGTMWLLGGTNWLGTILPWHEVTGYRQTNQMNLSNTDQ